MDGYIRVFIIVVLFRWCELNQSVLDDALVEQIRFALCTENFLTTMETEPRYGPIASSLHFKAFRYLCGIL